MRGHFHSAFKEWVIIPNEPFCKDLIFLYVQKVLTYIIMSFFPNSESTINNFSDHCILELDFFLFLSNSLWAFLPCRNISKGYYSKKAIAWIILNIAATVDGAWCYLNFIGGPLGLISQERCCFDSSQRIFQLHG